MEPEYHAVPRQDAIDGIAPASTRTVLTTQQDVRAASLGVARAASRQLSIFTQDLEPSIYGEEAFLETVKRLVLARSYARVRVLLADPARAAADENRFLSLARRLTTCIELRSMHGQNHGGAGAFIIADDNALMYRLHASRWDGIWDTHDPAVARRYLNYFDEIWAASAADPDLRQMRI